jgi:hypothetical protein
VSRRQANRWSQQEDEQYYQQQQQQYQQPAPAPAPSAAPQTDVVGQLQRLADLKAQGVLTDAEFAAQKAKILGS